MSKRHLTDGHSFELPKFGQFKSHLANSSLPKRHLANRHYAKRHFRHFTYYRHSASRHLANRQQSHNLVNSRRVLFVDQKCFGEMVDQMYVGQMFFDLKTWNHTEDKRRRQTQKIFLTLLTRYQSSKLFLFLTDAKGK
jgi:hypothetical protein